MYNHQMRYLAVTKEYNRQIKQLLDMAEKANREQMVILFDIMKKLKSSLQKLSAEHEKLRRYVNNPCQFNIMLKPYEDFLEKTRAEVEKAGEKL